MYLKNKQSSSSTQEDEIIQLVTQWKSSKGKSVSGWLVK